MSRLLVLLLFIAINCTAFANAENVLLINSYSWKTPWQQQFDDGFFGGFRLYGMSHKINLHVENMIELRRIMDDDEIFNYLKNKYKSEIIDLVLQNDAASVPFVAKHKDELFTKAQFFSYINANIINSIIDIIPGGYMTPSGTEQVETVKIMQNQIMNLKKIYLISGMLKTSLVMRDTILEKIKKIDNIPEIVLIDDISYEDMMKLVPTFKADTAIYYLPFLQDNTGKRYIPLTVLDELSKVAKVPIYSSWDTFIGHGIVGGKLLSGQKVGKVFAEKSISILEGTPAQTIKQNATNLTAFMFDQELMKKWNIDKKSIPDNSILINNDQTVWDEYKYYIIASLTAIFFQGLLIFALVIARRKSIVAEEKYQATNKMLEKLLDISADKVRTLSRAVEQSSSLVLITDVNGNIEYVNSTFEGVMGYKLEEIKGRTPAIFSSGKHDKEYYEQLWRTLSKGEDWKGEFINLTKSGDEICVLSSVSPVVDDEGTLIHYVSVQADITSRKETEKLIHYLAYHDALTDLPSLRLARNEIDKAIAFCNRHNAKLAVMYLDLDDFKSVNDSFGHDAGDELLKQVSKRIRSTLRDTDIVARIGGDEFLVIQTEVKDEASIRIFATKIIKCVKETYDIFGNTLSIGLSIGIAVYPTTALSQDDLLKFSDNAMYASKQRGKNQYTIFQHPEVD